MPNQDQVERVLVVAAHPDDVDFSVGGTVASFTAAGVVVTYCVITDGDAGGDDRAATRADVAAVRRREQEAAAKVLGVRDVRFLGYKDGELAVSLDLRRDISRVIRQVRPGRMLVHSPERDWHRLCTIHPDHLAAGEASVFAVYPDSRNPFAHPSLLEDESLDAWTVPEVWMFGTPEPNHWVDVTEFLSRQLAALREHHSQTDQMADLGESITRRGTAEAVRAGLPPDRLAEAFMSVDTG